MNNWKKCRLGDVCYFGKDRIDIANLNLSNYISTENMLPERGGITEAANLPSVEQTPCFFADDILVSNIRPYFKKIWRATFSGGCSPDVLVFKAKENISKRYLYYILSADIFFNYCTTTSKGTKMPRGDKIAIMNYPVNLPPLSVQRKIAAVLSSLDDKIELNNRINANLEQQAQAIFKSWFVDFEPFGGKMPKEWKKGTMSDICCYSNNKVNVEYLSLDNYFSTENMQPNRQGALQAASLPNVKQTTACKKGDVLVSNIRPNFKKIFYCFSDCGCSTDVLCFVPNNSELSTYLYSALYSDNFFDYMVAGVKGTKMPRGDKQQIMKYPICIPTTEYFKQFNQIVSPMLEAVYINRLEINNLSSLRDALLPKLMSGEIKV